MLIESYRNLSKELLLTLVQFNLSKIFHLDRSVYVSHYYSVTNEQAIWEVTDRNKRDVYLYAARKVPNLKIIKREAERMLKKTALFFADVNERTKFTPSDLKKIADDPEIVGRYSVKAGKIFIFVLYK
ncbi:MAG: hypothetical protein LBK50_03960 [Candidatus Nomurabacteria bacterium]|jgi:hypothetical protein|nr:hypothetical protein [Candidatus Nomurabacteria bacterium]